MPPYNWLTGDFFSLSLVVRDFIIRHLTRPCVALVQCAGAVKSQDDTS